VLSIFTPFPLKFTELAGVNGSFHRNLNGSTRFPPQDGRILFDIGTEGEIPQ